MPQLYIIICITSLLRLSDSKISSLIVFTDLIRLSFGLSAFSAALGGARRSCASGCVFNFSAGGSGAGEVNLRMQSRSPEWYFSSIRAFYIKFVIPEAKASL